MRTQSPRSITEGMSGGGVSVPVVPQTLAAPEEVKQPAMEVPSYLPWLVMDVLGYPSAIACGVACQSWRRQFEQIYRRELLELQSVCGGSAEYLQLPATTKSTISVAFGPDERSFASTHGDHTVKVVDFANGRVKATLIGHPRTPWTVKFHPSDPDVLASGCLGFEARIWRVSTGECVRKAEFDRAIISLSFHPEGDILAVAAGTYVYLWHYASGAPPTREFAHPHPIRCLRFLPKTGALVVGAANGVPITPQPPPHHVQHHQGGRGPTAASRGGGAFRGVRGGGGPGVSRGGAGAGAFPASRSTRNDARAPPSMSPPQRQRATFQLVVCDFDLHEAHQAAREALAGLAPGRRAVAPVDGSGRAISGVPRCVLRHALFYNDGGFDVSPCGSFLTSCAELWVPEYDSDDDDDPFLRDDLDGPRSPSPPRRRRGSSLSSNSSVSDENCGASKTRPPLATPRTVRAERGRSGSIATAGRTASEEYKTGAAVLDDDAPASLVGISDDEDDDDRLRRRASEDRDSLASTRTPTRFRSDTWARAAPAAPEQPRRCLDDRLARVRVGDPVAREGTTTTRRRRAVAVTARSSASDRGGRYQPHLVVVSLTETQADPATGELGAEGKLLLATPLDDRSFACVGADTAGSDIVTSVKLSPTAAFVLLGHSRGGDVTAGDGVPRVVSVVYRVGDVAKVDVRNQIGDDVNIARFHPVSGAGLVYGTKQGRICKIVPPAASP